MIGTNDISSVHTHQYGGDDGSLTIFAVNRDLTEDIPAITAHWEKEKIAFEAVYTGYLGSTQQIGMVRDLISRLSAPGALAIVDPAMADNGKLYPAFDGAYVEAMKELAFSADIILPNITEACFLTGMEYRETYDEGYIAELLDRLTAAGAKTVILTMTRLRSQPYRTIRRSSIYNARRRPIWACTTRPAAAGSNTVEVDSYDSPPHPSAVGR